MNKVDNKDQNNELNKVVDFKRQLVSIESILAHKIQF